MSKLDKYKNGNIQDDGGYNSKDFMDFARDFKKELESSLPSHIKLVAYSKGHYYVSGFVLNEETDNHAYFSISDVRYFTDSWIDDILIRSAEGTKDFRGGTNNRTSLKDFAKDAERITQ